MGGAAQDSADWQAVVAKARGQTVAFNAWGGSDAINRYLEWARTEIQARYGITVRHVKVSETSDVVRRIGAEKDAGRLAGGSADVVWINGQNFAVLKERGLLYGPITPLLPTMALVDPALPIDRDFSVPVEGLEAPWGKAQLTFLADSATTPTPPDSMNALLAFAIAQPGRVTYPRPPSFHGMTFLKQAMLEATPPDQWTQFQSPADAAGFAAATAPLWAYLDRLHPHLWRGGRQFPASNAEMHAMLADGELRLSLTFNPNEGANLVAQGRVPDTTRAYHHRVGTIGNIHFLAIPFNSSSKEAALVWIDFLLSPEAQARKADIALWGDPSVLHADHLPPPATEGAQARLQAHVPPAAPVLAEPHASWVELLEREWLRRYGR